MAFLLIFSLLLCGVFVNSASNINPIRYELWLKFDRDNIKNYTGHVNIDFVTKIKLKKFLINSGVTIDNVNLLKGGESVSQDLNHSYDRKKTREIHKAGLIFEPFTEYTLSINFSNEILYQNGIHAKEYYVNDVEDKRFYITTDFLPFFAHTVFPCFEISDLLHPIIFKSTFKLHITHDKKYTAISNTPGTTQEVVDNYVETTFEETPMISIHTLKFILTKLHSKSLENSGAIKYNIYAEDSALHETEYLFNRSEIIMSKVEEYFGMKYPLKKLDIFLDRSISSDHTEQFGLISARCSDYLANPNSLSFSDEIYLNVLPVQSFVQQYLGNIVTPKSLSKEHWMFNGLTHYLQYDFLKEIINNDQLVDWYFVNMPSSAFNEDLAIYDKVLGYTPIGRLNRDEIFKKITFYRGGAIFRMVSDIIGKDTFKKAIQYFIRENKFKSVTLEEFYAALNQAVQEDHTLPDSINLKTFIESWSNAFGYPMLNVTRDYTTGHLKLTQNRCLSYYWKIADTFIPATWWLPYNFASRSHHDFTNTTPTGWMKNTPEEDIDSHVPNDDWIIFNKKQCHHYIVNYDIENWNMIVKELNDGDLEKIHYLNRAQLLFDAYFLSKHRYLDNKILFDLLNYMRRETNYVVWKAADFILEDIRKQFINPEYSMYFKNYVNLLTYELYDKYSMETDNFDEAAIKFYITQWACQVGNQKCKEETETAADHVASALLHSTPTKIHPSLYKVILGFGFSDEKYSKLWQYIAKVSYTTRQSLIVSLRYNQNKTVFEDFLTKIFLTKSLQPEFDAREEAQIMFEIKSYYLLPEIAYNVISKKPAILFDTGNEKNLYRFLISALSKFIRLDKDQYDTTRKIFLEAQKLRNESTATAAPDFKEN